MIKYFFKAYIFCYLSIILFDFFVQMMKESADQSRINIGLKQTVHKYHSAILSACPTKNLPTIDDLGKPPAPKVMQPLMAVPTAAALKMGVGFPLNNMTSGRHDTTRVLSSQACRQDPLLLSECGICRQRRDQHLLAKCDTCHLHYHLYCLNPPLTRLPKKSKLYGWQCSECDKSSESEMDIVKEKGSRRSRTRHSKDLESSDIQVEVFTPKVKIKPVEPHPMQHNPITNHYDVSSSTSSHNYVNSPFPTTAPPIINNAFLASNPQLICTTSYNTSPLLNTSLDSQPIIIARSGKKRRRDKHRSRYSPDNISSSKEHKRKRKKKSLDIENPNTISHPRITIKVYAILFEYMNEMIESLNLDKTDSVACG